MNKYKNAIGACSDVRNKIDGRADCAVISMVVLADMSYEDAYAACELMGRMKGRGMHLYSLVKAFKEFSGKSVSSEIYPRQKGNKLYSLRSIGKGYPTGRYLIYVDGHFTSLVDGVIEDWANGRCKRVHVMYKIG